MIDNRKGHKLSFAINLLVSILVKDLNYDHHHHVQQIEPKEVKSF